MFYKTAYRVGVVVLITLTGAALLGCSSANGSNGSTDSSANSGTSSSTSKGNGSQSVQVPATYESMDTNGDMMVSRKEAMAAMPNLNFKVADTNGDDELSIPEYLDLKAAVANGTWTNKAVATEPVPKIKGYDENPVDVVTHAKKGTLVDPYKTSNLAVVKAGHESFLNHGCSSCHGGNGGGGMCPPLDNGVWIYGSEHLDDTLFRLVSLGSQKLQESGFSRVHPETPALMPQQGGLTVKKAGDLWKIITWVKSINQIKKQ